MLEKHGSVLVPDFQQHYGLRLVEVVQTWHPVEVVLLIAGLPPTSRYAARAAGEETGAGWDTQDWLLMDLRNSTEALRATVVSLASGKKKSTFRPWEHYPGKAVQEKAKQKATINRIGQMATPVTE